MVTVALSKKNLHPWSAKGSEPMREWGSKGMAWPNISVGEKVDAKESVALTTECSGLPFTTWMPTVGAWEL